MSNGVYAAGGAATPGASLANRVMISKTVTVWSVAGPTQTFIEGQYSPPLRCAYLGAGAALVGFTLEQGNAAASGDYLRDRSGGGALLTGGVVSNCVIRYNVTASGNGGGVYCAGGGLVVDCEIYDNDAISAGGAQCSAGGEVRTTSIHDNNAGVDVGGVLCDGGIVDGCIISNNTVVDADVGGASAIDGGVLRHCVITRHSILETEFSAAGGVYLADGGTAEWCLITANESREMGGGAHVLAGGVLRYCTVVGNTSLQGAGVQCERYGVVENVFIAGNSGQIGGGLFVAGAARNCTVGGNQADWRGGGIYCAPYGTVANTISYYNTAAEGPNVFQVLPGPTVNYSCALPAPTGAGNITNDPFLIGLSNPHIASNSPCIGAGNNALVAGTVDIDGEPRIVGTVDIGCDEVIPAGLTGVLAVAIQAEFTNAVVDFPLTFVADIAGKAQAYRWAVAGHGSIAERARITTAWSAAGAYQIALTAWNADAPAGVSATVPVQIVPAFTNYASVHSATPVSPYTTWATAATRIQDAINVCPCGGVVLVTNGVYDQGGAVAMGVSNRIALTRPITICSVCGPDVTRLLGAGPPGAAAIRGAYVGPAATLAGFTLSNGATARVGADSSFCGGGLYADAGAVVSNCIIAGNRAWYRGGGLFCGPSVRATDCQMHANFAGEGGGVYCDCASLLESSCVSSNQAAVGGGVFLNYGSQVNRCVLRGNNCFASDEPGYGAGAACLNGSSIANCLICSNFVVGVGIGAGVACLSQDVDAFMTINNCTIVTNRANIAGGVYCTATLGQHMWATVRNSIVVDNHAPVGPNYVDELGTAVYAYCCTTPAPYGPGNITSDPAFANAAAGDYHLAAWSPCIDAGTNAYAVLPWDLDGNPRIIDGLVDMGCYEFVPEPGCSLLPCLLVWLHGRRRTAGNIAARLNQRRRV